MMQNQKCLLRLIVCLFFLNAGGGAVGVSTFAQGSIALGQNLLGCDSLELDPGVSGTSYLWSTGQTTPTIWVSTSGTYWVAVTTSGGVLSDTVNVNITSAPSGVGISDTFLCGTGTLDLIPSQPADLFLFYEDSLYQNLIAVGDTLNYQVDSSSTIWAEAINGEVVGIGAPDASIGTGGNFANILSGIQFSVYEEVLLLSAEVYTNNATSFDVQLRDDQGNILHTKSVSTPGAVSAYPLPLEFLIPAGANYELVATNITGGRLLFRLAPTYPYGIDGVGEVTSGVSVIGLRSDVYYSFYNLQLYRVGQSCRSNLEKIAIESLPSPQVDLGSDTILCDQATLTLDVTNPQATYLWSTADTTESLSIDSFGVYWVQVSIGNCTVEDSISISRFDTPSDPLVPDSLLCSSSEVVLTNSSGGVGQTLWYADAQKNQLLGTGSSINFFAFDSTKLWVEALATSILSQGAPDNTLGSNNNQTNLTTGIQFDLSEPLIIQSATIYTNGEVDFDVQLLDDQGQVINERRIQDVSLIPKKTIQLDFALSPGSDYRLIATNFRKGRTEFMFFNQFPVGDGQPLTVKNGVVNNTPRTDVYYTFYDLRCLPLERGCPNENLRKVEVGVAIPHALPDSVYSCTPTVLDVGFTYGTFIWNTGATTPSLLVDSSGQYEVTVQHLSCSISFETDVTLPQGVGFPTDGIFCGNVLGTNYGSDAQYVWSTGDTTSSITVSQSGTYSVEVQEPRGCLLRDTITITGFSSFPDVSLGADTSGCGSVLLTPQVPTVGSFTYQWSTGDTSSSILATSSGLYRVEVINEFGCASSDSVSVFVSPLPVSDFFVEDTVYSANLTVQFTNSSSPGSYFWDFGDGNTSTQFSPLHTYSNTGDYCVSLVTFSVINNCGSDTTEKCFKLLEGDFTNLQKFRDRDQIVIYPSRVRDKLNIDMPDDWLASHALGQLEIRLIHSEGTQVLGASSMSGAFIDQSPSELLTLHLSGYASGAYFLLILDHHRHLRSTHRIWIQ